MLILFHIGTKSMLLEIQEKKYTTLALVRTEDSAHYSVP